MRIFSVIAVALVMALLAGNAATPENTLSVALAARAQIGKTLSYDPAYRVLDYPNGDLPIETGVCADVVVRAPRQSLGLDLQKLVYEDMKLNFSKYPQNWVLKSPDKNIDHRRVLNLQTYFKRSGWDLPVSEKAKDYQPGDIVTCIVPPHLPHIMVVSERTNASGQPLVIHNIGGGAQEEDRLFDFKITGHYRVKRTEPSGAASPSAPTRSITNQTSAAVGRRS
jgi:uncharacterized protein YijF (DUF1287 family)